MGEMHGARRVVTFCLLTAVLPTVLLVIPLYLRHSMYADVSYSVAESDVLEAVEGISTVFCQEQILRMNSTFRAFQLKQMPPLSNQKKHIQLKKSMILPDDTVEYWGFYLLAGSNISFHACSRFDGAGVLVVKGERNLKTCQSMEAQYTNVKYQKGYKQVKVKTANSREIKTTQLKIQKELQALEAEQESAIHALVNRNNKKTVNRENDALEELTRDVKDFITNYPSKKDNMQNSGHNSTVENQKEQLHKNILLSNLSHVSDSSMLKDPKVPSSLVDVMDSTVKRKRAISALTKQLQETDIDIDNDKDSLENIRPKRKSAPLITGHILDAGVGHGGNANVTEGPGESSDSSFEASLRRCYDNEDIFSKDIYPTSHCSSNYSLKYHNLGTLQFTSDGYYYFIFYSDNDHNENPVHVHFDIHKTTYQHTNFTRGCVNQTECKFPITFWSSEIVIVEVPTRDGIEHEDGDASVLISSCYPRMSIYAIFPVAVLFLILGCAFL